VYLCSSVVAIKILGMAEPETNEEPPKQSGQFLGCLFSLLAVGFIFFTLFFFMRSCG